MNYKLHYMPGQEFDRLPYKGARDALGLADPTSGHAYVRDTGMPMMDRFTAEHELQELIAKTSPHEEDGIRYKKGGVWRNILPTALGAIGSVLFPAASPAIWAGVGAASNAGMQQYAKSNHPEQLGEPGGWGTVADLGMGALSGYGGASAATGFGAGWNSAGQGASTLSKIGSGLKGAVMGTSSTTPQVATSVGTKTLGAGTGAGVYTAAPINTAALANSGAGIASGAGKIANTVVPWGGTSTENGIMGAFGKAQKVANTTGGQLISEGYNKLTALPQSSSLPVVGAMTSSTPGTSGALGRFSSLSSNFTNQPISEADLQAGWNSIDENALQQTTGIMNQFRGSTIEGNSQYSKALANMQKGVQNEKQQFQTELQGKANTQALYDQIKSSNSLSDDQMKAYANLTKLSDAELALYVGNDPTEFRTAFSQFL